MRGQGRRHFRGKISQTGDRSDVDAGERGVRTLGLPAWDCRSLNSQGRLAQSQLGRKEYELYFGGVDGAMNVCEG